jgi:uncharacterized protein DUF1707
MASDHMIRASDRDRDAVVATLRDAYTAGRLTLEEFDERTTAAYASKTWGELRRLTEDLPTQPILGADVPGRRMDMPGQPLPALPTHPPRTNQSGGSPQRHGRRRGALVPFLAVWVILVLASRSPGVVVPAALLMMMVVFMALARRR